MKIEKKEGLKNIRVAHNKKLFWAIVILFIALIGLVICIKIIEQKENNKNNTDINKNNVQIANPASTYCIQNNGTLEMRKNSDGGQYGICILQNGSECEEWKYYHGECR